MCGRNVVLVCLDTVRKDYFDEYAPRIQSHSDISFSECRAVSSWTVPSHASILTGSLPHQHGIHSHNMDFSGIHRTDTFLGDLGTEETLGVSANPYASLDFGFGTLFDEFHDITPSVPFPEGMYLKDFSSDRNGPGKYVDFAEQALGHEHPIQSLLNGGNHVLKRLKPGFLPNFGDDGGAAVSRTANRAIESATEPFFLFLNFMDAHGPFEPSLRYDRSLYSVPRTWSSGGIDIWELNNRNDESPTEEVYYYRDLYAASIDYLDRLVSDLIDELRRVTDLETTTLITADHGENLSYPGEGGLIEHKSSLSEGVLHVPFEIVNPPRSFTQPKGYFSHLDIGELVVDVSTDTARDYERKHVPAEVVGIGPAKDSLDGPDIQYWDRMIRAAYRDDRKFVWDTTGRRVEYTVGEEPSRQRIVAEEVTVPPWGIDLFDGNTSEYKSRQIERDERIDVDDSTAGRLKDLGYL
jgi:arylsulfatase A-like enzyme